MVKVLFFETPYNKEILLNNKLINYLKKNKIKSIALFASIQFIKLDKVKKQLKNINIKTTKAKRTNKETQILGCDTYHDSFKEDIISKTDVALYIGDGLFHPQALLFSQIYKKQFKKIISYNPVTKQIKILNKKDIQKQINRIKANLKKFLMAKTIGIIVSTKPGQQYLELSKKLKQKLKNKKVYIFITNNIDLNELENFPFIQSWVNSACPRIGFDNIENKSIINIKEAFDSTSPLS